MHPPTHVIVHFIMNFFFFFDCVACGISAMAQTCATYSGSVAS